MGNYDGIALQTTAFPVSPSLPPAVVQYFFFLLQHLTFPRYCLSVIEDGTLLKDVLT